ncbi:MAG: GrpB family protein [Muribaculaceae bacterium]|nr:GrpB family protein [Muribaculaceae bacterium]
MDNVVAKELKDMSLEELWELFPIELVAHRSVWREWAADEIATLSDALAIYAPIITHIGSTAVSDIWAKPIIDILIELPEDTDWLQIKYILERSEYICMSQSETRLSFNKGYTLNGFAEKVFHVHVRKTGDNDEICFRDYLMANPEIAKEYEALKMSLLPKYRNNRDGYTEAKTEFVRRVTALAKQLKNSAL